MKTIAGDGRTTDSSLVVSMEINGIVYQGVLFAQAAAAPAAAAAAAAAAVGAVGVGVGVPSAPTTPVALSTPRGRLA